MEFNEKLQELRKQKGLTQEELAESLYVSRTAISKWESGRGYPNIDSLKALANFFSVTIDELLSGEEVLTIAEEKSKAKGITPSGPGIWVAGFECCNGLFCPVLRAKGRRLCTSSFPYIPDGHCSLFESSLLCGCNRYDRIRSLDSCTSELPWIIMGAK